MSLKIGWALQDAFLSGERIRFDEQGTAWMTELGCSFCSMLHNPNYETFFT
jgi:hypothetical protein